MSVTTDYELRRLKEELKDIKEELRTANYIAAATIVNGSLYAEKLSKLIVERLGLER